MYFLLKKLPLVSDISIATALLTVFIDRCRVATVVGIPYPNREPADFVFIFGSVAKKTAGKHSDIDLFVIGDCGLREVTRRIHQAASQIGQEVNPYVISRDDFLNRLHGND
ncbi:MAG: nucleotidyltransferase domain-containing protein, partial [Spirochaetales bacterium]|nr:nucleotidyltransferase domain-containing protein [Spirochaetales bacterium]